MAITWKKISQVVETNTRILTYGVKDHDGIRIESRKKRIPRANGIGGWFNTTYIVITPDGEEIEKLTLKEAKEIAEKMILEGKA